MPIGILINSGSIIVGGIIGSLLKKRLNDSYKQSLNLVLAFSAMTLGLISLIKLQNLTLVIASILIGTIIGELLRIYDGIKKASLYAVRKLYKKQNDKVEEGDIVDLTLVASAVVIFCFSGTGIFGAIKEGISNDSSILIAKSVLDLFTSMILASTIGYIVVALVLPQFVIMIALFLVAKGISPIMTDYVSANFVSVGGLITIMTGFNLLKLKEVKVLNALPSLIIIIILSILF